MTDARRAAAGLASGRAAAVRLQTAPLRPRDIEAVALRGAQVEVDDAVRAVVVDARAVLDRRLDDRVAVYGLNTGLGAARDQLVEPALLEAYQRQIVLTHAGAIGEPMADHLVRAILIARAAGLARGGSGGSPALLDALVGMLNAGLTPVIPVTGSVGASDLGHLAAVGLVAIGRGRARLNGRTLPGAEALRQAGLVPLRLAPKDALALISSNAVSIGVGALVARRAARVARMADLAGALSMEALDANLTPFDPAVQAAKPFAGQAHAAENIRDLLVGSRLERPGVVVSNQDALSTRTIPQVHGAFRQQQEHAFDAVAVELGGRGDNPLVLPQSDRTLSNGNFTPMVLALAFESLRLAAAHVGMLSERRMAKLVARAWSDDGRAARLAVEDPESDARYSFPGLMSYSAAALVAELKHLAAPITLGVPPLDFDVEDHASFANAAVTTAAGAMDKLETILSIEMLLAVHEIGQRGIGDQLGVGTGEALAALRAIAEGVGEDPLAADLVQQLHDAIAQLLHEQDSRVAD